MKPWHLRLLAFLVFAVSFALPAVHVQTGQPRAPGGLDTSRLPGYFCAFIANYAAPSALIKSKGSGVTAESVQVMAGGCVNLLVLAILFLSIWKRLVWTRLVLVAATLPCFVVTWMFFAKEHLQALIGHYLWVAGVLLFLLPEVMNLVRRPAKLTEISTEAQSAR
jgi:hypothetical protein